MSATNGLGLVLSGKIRVLLDLLDSPHTPTELASIERKHLSHISRALKDLRRNGLVEYTFSGSRQRYYKPTEDGYVMINQILRLTR